MLINNLAPPIAPSFSFLFFSSFSFSRRTSFLILLRLDRPFFVVFSFDPTPPPLTTIITTALFLCESEIKKSFLLSISFTTIIK